MAPDSISSISLTRMYLKDCRLRIYSSTFGLLVQICLEFRPILTWWHLHLNLTDSQGDFPLYMSYNSPRNANPKVGCERAKQTETALNNGTWKLSPHNFTKAASFVWQTSAPKFYRKIALEINFHEYCEIQWIWFMWQTSAPILYSVVVTSSL